MPRISASGYVGSGVGDGQVAVDGHLNPQLPQFAGSVSLFTHLLLHTSWP